MFSLPSINSSEMNLAELSTQSSSENHWLFEAFWPKIPINEFSTKASQRFADYVNSELSILETQSGRFVVTDRAEVINVVKFLREKRARTLGDILDNLGTHQIVQNPGLNRRAEIHALVELGARIWLTINVDTLGLAAASQKFPPIETLRWNEATSLQSLVRSRFNHETTIPGLGEAGMIPSHLNIAELCSKYRYRVSWSDSLLEHLTIRDEGGVKEIVFYEHLFCLKYQLEYADESPFPKDVIEEAIDTFNLLFPMTTPMGKDTRRFLRKENRNFYILGPCGRERRYLEFSNYKHWRYNIQQLVDIIAGPAPGWRQVLLDRDARNFEKVMTIWIGITATILALITIVFGILALCLALKANDLTRKALKLASDANSIAREALILAREANRISRDSYELDRRLACLAPNATNYITEFCT